MIILDTNIVSEPLKKTPDSRVVNWLEAQPAETLYLTSINLAELLAGVEVMPDGKRKTALREALGDFILTFFAGRILPFEEEAAKAFGLIMRLTRQQGRSLMLADAQIAAVALSRGCAVATRYVAPFAASGLRVINPFSAE